VSLALCPDGVSAVAPATYREPLCLRWALSTAGWFLTTSEGITPPSSLLRAHASHHPPRAAFGSLMPRVLAGCGEPLLEDGGSRRYLCVSVPRCLDLYPGGVVGAHTHYFPTTIGLPPVLMGRLPASIRSATSEREVMSELQSFAHVQASRFAATQVAPTAVP
jgi:hypothetical protein